MFTMLSEIAIAFESFASKTTQFVRFLIKIATSLILPGIGAQRSYFTFHI